MLLSVLIPVYNERTMVERCLAQVLAAPLPEDMERELIVVDDCSTDGTWSILERLAAAEPRIRLFRHAVNGGKGAAVRTAIEQTRGDFCLIQDADLEYDPAEYPRLLRPLLDGHADAVFGSRYLAGAQMRVLPFRHSLINKTLTGISNVFSNLSLTDMETCYKVFRTDLLKSIPIRSQRFGIEPELTIKAAKRKLRIYEVPISYHGRTAEEGKKIGWRDGIQALGVILRFWLIDDLYAQPYGRAFLNNLEGTPRYLDWMARLLRPHLGDRVLEVNAGIGTLAGRLMSTRLEYVATERDPLYLHALRNRFLRTPSVAVKEFDPDGPAGECPGGPFDTILCVNVLEYLHEPGFLRAVREWMAPGGVLIALVPQGTALFGSLDRTLGHKRRYNRKQLGELLSGSGFHVERTRQFNKIGAPAWLVFSRALRRNQINKLTLKIFDKTVWFWRLIDPLLPWPGLSLVVIARKETHAHNGGAA